MKAEDFIYAAFLVLGVSLMLFGLAIRRNSSAEDPRDERLRIIQQKFRAVHERAFRRKNIRRYLVRWGAVAFGVCLFLWIVQARSTWPFMVTLRHIAAVPNCDMARLVGLAPALLGEPGYYNRHDADSDGISCEALPD